MRFKKLVSTAAALALSATAFAGLGTQALAATTVIEEDFDDSTSVASYWTTATSGQYIGFTVEDGGYLSAASTATGSNRTSGITLTEATSVTSDYMELSIDFCDCNYNGTYTGNHGFAIKDSSGNTLFTLLTPNSWYGDATATLNSETLTGVTIPQKSTSDWYTLKTILNFEDHIFDYYVYAQGSTTVLTSGTSVSMSSAEATNVGQMEFYVNRLLSGGALGNYIDNFKLSTLTKPSYELSETSLTIDPEDVKYIHISNIIGTISTVSSSSDAVATAVINDDKDTITITGVADGKATVSITATNDGVTTTTQDISVVVGGASPVNGVLNYVDKNGNILKDSDSTSIGEVYAGDTVDVSDYIDDFKYTPEQIIYDTDGVTILYYADITYIASYSGSTNAEVSETGDIDLVFTLTENTYTATIDTVYHAKVVLSGTSTTGTEITDKTVYSAYSSGSGVATVTELPVGTYDVAITKGGYTDGAGKLTVTTSGSTYSSTTDAEIDGYLFYEDFDTVAESTNTYVIFGVYRNMSSSIKFSIENSTTDVTVPFVSTVENGTKITFTDLTSTLGRSNTGLYINFNNKSGDNVAALTLTTSFYTESDIDYYTGAVTIGNGTDSTTLLSIDSSTTTTSATGDFVITFANGKAYGSYNNIDFSFDVDDVEIGSLTFKGTSNNSSIFRMNGIKAESVATMTAATSDTAVGTISTPSTIYDADTDDEVSYADVVTGDVTTVYIKIDNATPEVAPTVTLNDETTTATTSKGAAWYTEYNGSYYFIYQFVDMADDLVGAKVTCGDLSATVDE